MLHLKRSWQTGEGIATYALLGVGVFLLYTLFKGDVGTATISTEELFKYASEFEDMNIQDIVNIYKSTQGDATDKTLDLGIKGAVMAFIYKLISRLITERVNLKKGGGTNEK